MGGHATTIVFGVIALVLGGIAYSRPGNLHVKGLKVAWEFSRSMAARILMAVLVSGFFSVLVPAELIAQWFGKEAGISGILIASAIGGFTPGGPIICFPLILVFLKAGAALAPLIAFVTAWSVFAFNRILAYEIPLMGFRFAALRILSSLMLPPLAGILTALLEDYIMLGF